MLQELAIMKFDQERYVDAWSFFKRYRANTVQSSAKMLLLGVQIANKLGDRDSLASFALSLKNLYPESREYRSYLKEFGR